MKSFLNLSWKRPSLCKTHDFRNQTKSQNTQKFSKCFLRLEGPSSSKSRRESWKFLYNLATRASTREQVAKSSRENF